VIVRRRPRWSVIGLFDVPAHVATGCLVLLNVNHPSRAWAAGVLAGSVAPDIDHVPLALRDEHPTADEPRPATHCLAAVAPLALAARLADSSVLAGAVAGALVHFARDAATGPGAPLLRPISRVHVRLPYAAYAAAVGALAARTLWKP
jgi:membrane-bound metal-dependent hydrolase YbcI (DUF457 family)